MALDFGILDQQLFLAVNGSHSAYFDQVMWIVSSRLSWALIMLAFLWTLRDKGWRQAVLAILCVALTVLIADRVSAGVIKGLVGRPRPSHEPALEGLVHIVNDYAGGPFGFVSSHAANAFGVALIAGLMMRDRFVFWTLFAWAVLQSYSRIYLGVHYPGDALGGVLLGFLSAGVVFVVAWAANRFWPKAVPLPAFTAKNGKVVNYAVLATVVIIAIIAPLWM